LISPVISPAWNVPHTAALFALPSSVTDLGPTLIVPVSLPASRFNPVAATGNGSPKSGG
jgi:hypothetical protein